MRTTHTLLRSKQCLVIRTNNTSGGVAKRQLSVMQVKQAFVSQLARVGEREKEGMEHT